MKTTLSVKNWNVDTKPEVLHNIHKKNVNITIYNRTIDNLEEELNWLVKNDIKLHSNGTINTVLSHLPKTLELSNCPNVLQDINTLLQYFNEVTNSKEYRLLLATIDNDMCRKFHMDNNNLRMLCTYKGQGTLWLTEDNINREALELRKTNEHIVIDENEIKQAKTGSILILKGAKYAIEQPNAIVHRSPTIKQNSEKRLLLRIDAN